MASKTMAEARVRNRMRSDRPGGCKDPDSEFKHALAPNLEWFINTVSQSYAGRHRYDIEDLRYYTISLRLGQLTSHSLPRVVTARIRRTASTPLA